MSSDLSYSYWEQMSITQHQDFIIVGGGFSGLTAALYIRQHLPKARIRIVERHHRSRTASTRNAGFACFGCLTEFMSDYRLHGDLAVELYQARFSGMQRMLALVSDYDVGYMRSGGFEPLDKATWQSQDVASAVDEANALLKATLGIEPYTLEMDANHLSLFAHHHLVAMPYEGQLNPVLLLGALQQEVMKAGVEFWDGVMMEDISSTDELAIVHTSIGDMQAEHVILTTNASVPPACRSQLSHLHPARNSVLVTKPIHLPLRGIYHLEDGYIYFRNTSDGRLLIGGGRHWHQEEGFTSSTEPDPRTIDALVSYAAKLLQVDEARLMPDLTWAGTICVHDTGRYTISSIWPRVTYIGGYNGMGVALAAEAAYHGVHNIVHR